MITDPIYLERVGQYADLARRYADAPFGRREGSSIEPELSRLEQLLAAEPPRVEKSPGLWTPRPKGLHPRSLAERKADEFYGPPLAARVEGAEIDPADLAPKLIYPAAIRRPDGSLASGAQWFQAAYKDRFPTPQGEARQFRRIPQADWQDLIASGEAPDLRPYLNWILDQDGVGSCAAEGLGGADDLRRRMFHGAPSGQPQATAPNPWFAYHTTSGGYDGGSSLEDNLAFYQRWGCAREAVWPRSKGWKAKPSEEAYADAAHYKLIEAAAFPVTDVELFGTFLLLGVPVYTGYEGHAWFAIWLVSTSKLIWVNSWSADWGQSGMGTLSFSSLRYGCYAVLTPSLSTQVYT